MSAKILTLISNINTQIIAPIVMLLFVLSLAMFFWGIANFMREADNKEAREVGQKHMLWGIIGMFIMVGAWGIITISINSIGGTGGDDLKFPSEIFE